MMAGARVTTMAVVVAAWLCAPAAMGQSARAPIPPHDGALHTLHWFDDLEAEQHEALTQEASVAAMAFSAGPGGGVSGWGEGAAPPPPWVVGTS